MASKGDTELHVSFEDQQKINKFARHNSKLDDIIEELKSKEFIADFAVINERKVYANRIPANVHSENELQALEDAESDLMLSVDQEKAPIGDVFIFLSMDEAQQMIDAKKESVAQETKTLKEQQDSLKQAMSDLKVQLYAKFGSNINLEPE